MKYGSANTCLFPRSTKVCVLLLAVGLFARLLRSRRTLKQTHTSLCCFPISLPSMFLYFLRGLFGFRRVHTAGIDASIHSRGSLIGGVWTSTFDRVAPPLSMCTPIYKVRRQPLFYWYQKHVCFVMARHNFRFNAAGDGIGQRGWRSRCGGPR